MRAVELAWAVAAAASIAALVLRRVLLRRRAVPAGVLRLAQSIPDALGDSVLVLDPAGRIVLANSAAARLAGTSVAALVDRDVAEISPELAALARGLERGPAAARVALSGPAGTVVRARTAVVRVSSRPPLALAVLRVLPRPAPPPLPRILAPTPERAERLAAAAAAGLGAAAAALHDPALEAADALSMFRLAAPPLAPGAEAALAAAEAAVEVACRRIAVVAAAAEHAAVPRRPLDVAALVEDLLATFPAPPGVRLTLDLGACRALADDRPVRAALREILGAAAAALSAGGEIAVSVRQRSVAAVVEIRTPAVVAAGGLALARALVVPQGGRVEDEAVPGTGSVVRVALEGAPALAPA